MSLFDRPFGSQATSQPPAVRLQLVGATGQQYYVLTSEKTWTWYQDFVVKCRSDGGQHNSNPGAWTWANADAESVAYSRQLEPLVIADYAGDGSVRGIEIIGRPNRTLEEYIKLAVAAGNKTHRQAVPGNSKWEPVTLLRSLSANAVTFRP